MFHKFFVVLFLFSITDAIFPELSAFDQKVFASSAEDSHVPKYRLSNDLEPISYELRVKTYVPGYIQFDESKNFTFDGHVVIKFKVLNETDKIEMFSKNLKLNEPKLSHPSKELRIEKTEPQLDTDKVVFHVNKNMTVQEEYILEIAYSGLMTLDSDVGLYPQAYKDKHGNKHYLASTQNEPFGARLILPCFDEPQFKAIWKVSIVHPRGTTALSNAMEIQETEMGTDWLQTSFDKTPQMSSYLLAMAIVNYKYKEKTIESISGKTIRFRVWLVPDLIDQATKPLEIGVKLISYYEKQLGQPYPLPKMDMIGLAWFGGGMENWGLIVYSLDALQSSDVVSHELAHQWFGNLVTMKFWDDLFLNEGFAMFIQTPALIGIGEQQDLALHYRELNKGIFQIEGKKYAPRAVHYELVWPKDYEDIGFAHFFPYDKASSAIRTIELVMGSRDFYEGIRLYLNRYHFGNVDYHDLLNTLSEMKPLNHTIGGPKSVAEFAETWILQPGYPIVTVKRINTTHVELTQKQRFENHSTKAKWWIPIFYKVNGDSKPMEWLFDTLYLEVKQDDLLLLNEDLNVLYCINHDNKTLNAIKDKVGDKEIFPWPSLQKFIENSIIAADVNCASYDSVLELHAEVFKHRLGNLKNHFAMIERSQKLDKKAHLTKSYNRSNFEEIDRFGSIVDFMPWDHHRNYVNEHQRY